MKINIINFSSLLVYLLPFSLLTGPFIPEIITIILNLFFFTFVIKNKLWKYFLNIYFYLFLVFYFYICIRSYFSIDMYFSLESSIPYIRFGILSLTIWLLIDYQKNFIKIFSIALLITFLIAVIDGYFQFFYPENLFGFESPKDRMNLLLNDSLILGGYLARFFPLLFAVLIYSFPSSRLNLIILFILFIVTDLVIYITGERTAFALLTLSSVFIIIFISKYKLVRITALIASIMLITIVTIFSPTIQKRNIDQTINQMTGTVMVENESGESSESFVILSREHHSHFMTALSMFYDKPIFGHGPNMFRLLCDKEEYFFDIKSCSTHPHNFYFQFLAELGLFGMSFLIIVIIYFSVGLVKQLFAVVKKRGLLFNDYQICLVSCFLINLWPTLPTLNFFNNWISIMMYIPVGFYLHSIYVNKSIDTNDIKSTLNE